MARASLLLGVLATALVALALAPAVQAELQDTVILRWTYQAQRVVRALQLTNQISSRLYAQVGIAQYKTCVYAEKGNAKTPGKYHPELAVAFASHAILARTSPQLAPTLLDNALLNEVNRYNAPVKVRDESAKLGLGVAFKILDAFYADKSLEVSYYRPPPAEGAPDNVYVFTPGQTFLLYPQYANGSTFIFPTSKIPELTKPYLNAWYKYGTPEYERENDYVIKYGGVDSQRTQYQTDTAYFWLGSVSSSGGQGSAGLTGMVQNISIALLPSSWGAPQQAKFFARLGTAFYDSIVAVWYVKHHYPRWRPITAIRKYNNASWTPLLGTPQHPDYPSAHQGIFGGGWGVLLRELKGDTKHTFTVTTDWPGLAPRTYNDLAVAADECLAGRVFAGSHWNQSCTDAFAIGRKVADYIYDNIDKVVYGHQATVKW